MIAVSKELDSTPQRPLTALNLICTSSRVPRFISSFAIGRAKDILRALEIMREEVENVAEELPIPHEIFARILGHLSREDFYRFGGIFEKSADLCA